MNLIIYFSIIAALLIWRVILKRENPFLRYPLWVRLEILRIKKKWKKT